jgi:hypothetical protein
MPYPLSRPKFSLAVRSGVIPWNPARAAELVKRYPNLSQSQIEELAAVLPRLNARDMALMIADEEIAPKLDAFWTRHRDLVTPSLSDYAVIGAILAFPMLAFLVIVLVS